VCRVPTDTTNFDSSDMWNLPCGLHRRVSSSTLTTIPIKRLTLTAVGRRRLVTDTSRTTLTDSFGRYHNYLRMSLTEKCNLRCKYCMPVEGVSLTAHEQLLSLDERKQTLSLFASLGANKLRFTGGEPTISKDLLPLINYARHDLSPHFHSVGITSNGIMLGPQLAALKQAGLSSVNISLDTFQREKFAEISRRDGKLLNRVLSSIFSAMALDIPVKVNCVVSRGMNDDELATFVAFARDNNATVRFIELMPFDGNKWDPKAFVGYFEMKDRIQRALV
jgi:molybdenum cofactor biosynthesis enzyme MoaA